MRGRDDRGVAGDQLDRVQHQPLSRLASSTSLIAAVVSASRAGFECCAQLSKPRPGLRVASTACELQGAGRPYPARGRLEHRPDRDGVPGLREPG